MYGFLFLIFLSLSVADNTDRPWFDWWGTNGNAYYPQIGGGFGSNGNYGCRYEYDLYRNTETCPDAVDVVFLMDSSGSVSSSDYAKMINFIKTVVNKFYLHPDYAQVSVIEFSSNVNVLNGLTHDACSIRQALNSNQINGGTDIGSAISRGHDILKNGRKNVPKHMILITDGSQTVAPPNGMSYDGYVIDRANKAKEDNIIIYSIGVGSAQSYETVLRSAASAPVEEHFSYIENFNQLNSILDVLTNSTCPTQNTNEVECNEKGYKEYLSKWTIQEKSTSRDPASPEFKKRLQYYIESCELIKEWNTRNKYPMEFTFYADWHPDEFERLTDTKQRYSGRKVVIPSTVPVYNNSNLRYLLPSLDPCDDVVEGGNTLRSYISKPQNCSVSWAFAVTNSIEYAIKKFYKDEFNQEITVALSAQELIDCVGKEYGVEESCIGLPIVWGFDYAYEHGIAYRQYYPHTNKEGECQIVEDEKKYFIAAYERPRIYNKYGLFDLLKKGPVAVSLGLDPEYFQYYRSDRAVGPYFDTSYWRPSVYGVVLEYYQYVTDSSQELAEWPYFAIETRLRACDSMVFKVVLQETTSTANFAGIAGFALRPIVNERIN